jgi:hypothetical protein
MTAQFVWLQISDGQISLTEVPDMVSVDEMRDRYGQGNLLVVDPFDVEG